MSMNEPRTSIARRRFVVLAAAGALFALTACSEATPAAKGTVVVYKSPTCQCCSRWVQHLRDAGFAVEVHNETAMNEVKTRFGVPPALASCHTATVDGYVMEGHVPAADLRRFLAQKTGFRGLAVAGMPAGSPGMEQVGTPDAYDVVAFDAAGGAQLFAHHEPGAASP